MKLLMILFLFLILNPKPSYKIEVMRNGKVVHIYEKVTDLVQGQSCIKFVESKTNGFRQICETVKITKL